MHQTLKRTALLVAIACLSACGGGGGGGGQPANTSSTSGSSSAISSLSGVAATGKAMANVQISVRDALGVVRSTTSDSDGAFNLDIANLTAPLVVAATSGGTSLYSPVFSGDTHVNVNQLTTAQLRQWLRSQCTDDICRGQASTQMLFTFLDNKKGDLAKLTATTFDNDLLALTSTAGGNAGNMRTDKTFAANGKGWDALLDKHPYGTISVDDNGISSSQGLLQTAITTIALSNAPALPQPTYGNQCKGTLNNTVYRTPNLDMYGQNVSPEEQRRAALLADYYLRKERNRFELIADTGLTGARAQYCVDGTVRSNAGAAFADRTYINAPPANDEDGWRRTLHHETVHMAANVASGNTDSNAGGPRMVETWFNEGIAMHFAGQDGWLTDVDGWFADSVHTLHPMDVGMNGMVGNQMGASIGYHEMYRLMMKQLEATNIGPQELARRVASVMRIVKNKPIDSNPGVFRNALKQYLFGNTDYAVYRDNLQTTLKNHVADHTIPLSVSGDVAIRGTLLPEGRSISCDNLQISEDVELVNGKLLLPKVDGSYPLLVFQGVSKTGDSTTLTYYPLQTITVSNGVATPATLPLGSLTTGSISCNA